MRAAPLDPKLLADEGDIDMLRLRLRAVVGHYNELIMAVASKFPGESRHDTALRYIREREATAHSEALTPAASAS